MNVEQILKELQALDAQNPGSWPFYIRIAAVVLLGIGIIAGGYFYFITPQLEELERVQKDEQTLRQEFETKQKKVAALDAYKAQLEEMQRSFGAMLRQLPGKTEMEKLLNDISQTRVASSLEEELFQPQGEAPKDFYVEVPNRIITVGTYHQMGAFVSGVAALPRIVTIDDVEIRAASATAKGQLRMTALAKTYRYMEEGETSGAAPAKGAKK